MKSFNKFQIFWYFFIFGLFSCPNPNFSSLLDITDCDIQFCKNTGDSNLTSQIVISGLFDKSDLTMAIL